MFVDNPVVDLLQERQVAQRIGVVDLLKQFCTVFTAIWMNERCYASEGGSEKMGLCVIQLLSTIGDITSGRFSIERRCRNSFGCHTDFATQTAHGIRALICFEIGIDDLENLTVNLVVAFTLDGDS